MTPRCADASAHDDQHAHLLSDSTQRGASVNAQTDPPAHLLRYLMNKPVNVYVPTVQLVSLSKFLTHTPVAASVQRQDQSAPQVRFSILIHASAFALKCQFAISLKYSIQRHANVNVQDLVLLA